MALILLLIMAVTDWTSEGMDWSTLDDKRLYPYMEAIRQAVVERQDAVGQFVIADYKTPLVSGMMTDYREVRQTGFRTQDYMDSLISGATGARRYCNQYDEGGDWDNVDHEPPPWTEADMLTQIGAGSRIRIVEGAPFTAAWARQQYLMLNELIWTRYTQTTSGSPSSRFYEDEDTWANVVAGFNATSWSAAPSNINIAGHVAWRGSGTPDYYKIIRYRQAVRNANSFPTSMNKTSVSYMQMTKSGWSQTDRPLDDYFNADYGTTEDYWAEVGSNLTPNGDASESTMVGDFGDSTVSQPTNVFDWDGYDTGRDVSGGPWGPGFGYIVAKWDVTGGFEYVP